MICEANTSLFTSHMMIDGDDELEESHNVKRSGNTSSSSQSSDNDSHT